MFSESAIFALKQVFISGSAFRDPSRRPAFQPALDVLHWKSNQVQIPASVAAGDAFAVHEFDAVRSAHAKGGR